jgi:hypothetical protein
MNIYIYIYMCVYIHEEGEAVCSERTTNPEVKTNSMVFTPLIYHSGCQGKSVSVERRAGGGEG